MAKKDEKETSTSSGSKRLDADHATPAPDAEVPHGKVEPDVDTTKAAEAKPAAKKSTPARPQPVIADLLADPAFDPDGKVRSKLAQYSMQHGARALAPADLVDADGNVVEQPA